MSLFLVISESLADPKTQTKNQMTTEIKPLKKAITGMLPTENIKAMIKSLVEFGKFEVKTDWSSGTVSASWNGREVLSAIQKGSNGPWIYRHHPQLFA